MSTYVISATALAISHLNNNIRAYYGRTESMEKRLICHSAAVAHLVPAWPRAVFRRVTYEILRGSPAPACQAETGETADASNAYELKVHIKQS